MQKKGWRLAAYIAPPLMGLALVLPACSESIQPSAGQSARPAASFTDMSYSTNPDEIVMVDEYDGDQYDGLTFTLNIPTGEIRISDGRMLRLSPEYRSAATEIFRSTLEADQLARDLSAIELGSTCTPDPNWEIGGCAETMRLGNKPQASGTLPAIVRRSSSFKRRATRQRGSIEIQEREVRSRRLDPSFLTNWYGDVCTEVATAAAPTARQYFRIRSSIVKDLIPVAVAEGVSGVWRVLAVPPGTAVAAKVATIVSEHLGARISLGYLAGMWNDHDCSSKKIHVGPIVRGGGSFTPNMVCREERWEISFDGGHTWHPIDVTVCDQVPS